MTRPMTAIFDYEGSSMVVTEVRRDREWSVHHEDYPSYKKTVRLEGECFRVVKPGDKVLTLHFESALRDAAVAVVGMVARLSRRKSASSSAASWMKKHELQTGAMEEAV